jgi:ribosome-associated protein
MYSHVVISNTLKIPFREIRFQTSRSGGPGGQNVNKLETRIELFFDVATSPSIPEYLRKRLLTNLSSIIDSDGILRIVVQESRSQWKNKQLGIEKFTKLLRSAIIIPRHRIATKPTRSSQELRMHSKKMHSKKKELRKIIPD